jgi:ankyrin repeat protein
MLSMSLDSGGDFAALRSLAASTLANVKSAPLRWRRTEDTIQSLISVLDIIEKDFQSDTSILKTDHVLEQRLGVFIQLCLASLTKLSDSLAKPSIPDLGEDSNVDELHRELSLRYTDLADFLNQAGLGAMAKSEAEVDGSQNQEALILEAVDKILTDGSLPREESTIPSEHSNDHATVWKHLREKLKLSGFKLSDVERHKSTIFHKLHESLHIHRPAMHGAPGTPGGPIGGKSTINIAESAYHVDARPPLVTFRSHAERQMFNTSGNYRPPAASTIYDDSDDDARSVGSEASTLLGPVDEHRPHEHYILRPPTTSRPSSRNTRQMAEPRSPRITVDIPEEKIVDVSSSPREAGRSTPTMRTPTWSNNEPIRTGQLPRNVAAVPRPNSPRARDQRYDATPRRPTSSRSISASSKYDYDVLIGRRTPANPVWHYRRNGDMFPARNQSSDVQDDALPTAAQEGRMNEVQRLLWEERNIESFGSRSEHVTRNFHRTTALYRAAKQGQFAIVHLLLRHGANPNPRRNDGKSLVRLLADDGLTEMLRLLLEYGANVQHQGAVPQAAWGGHYTVIQLLLEYGADVDEIEKQTALYRASSKGYPQIVELLLREGANVHYMTTSGHSALYRAVENENYQCARLLLSYGARPHVGIGRNGETILYVACDLGHEPMVRSLLRRGALPNECTGYQNGIAINDRRRYPLHIAARRGHLTVARLLLDYDADVNTLTEDGRGPVDIAIERTHEDVVDFLSRAGGFPLQAMHERGSGFRGQDMDSQRGSFESQHVRRFSSSLPERPHRERQTSTLQLQSSRSSIEQEPKRRSKSSTGSRRSEASSQSQSSSKLNATAALGLLASGAMFLAGG